MIEPLTTFIFKDIDSNNVPRCNNRHPNTLTFTGTQDWTVEPTLSRPHCITLNKIDQNNTNYGYVVLYDFNFVNYDNGKSLIDNFVKNELIPPQILTLIQQNKCKLYFDAFFEGYAKPIDLNIMYKLIEHYGFSPTNFVYVTSALNAKRINEAYCQTNNIPAPLTVLEIPVFDHIFKRYAFDAPAFTNENAPIRKKFICLNQRPRLHRYLLASMILTSKELRTEFYYSLTAPDQPWRQGQISNLGITKEDFEYVDSITPTLKLDVCPANTFDAANSGIDNFLRTSMFNVVTETHFLEALSIGLPTLFFTEKIFKPFWYKQIPIVVGGPLMVAGLRERGFDVFDDIVDHTYDLELDPFVRLLKVVEEIKRLNSKYSLEQLADLRTVLQPRFKHNTNNLSRTMPAI